MMPVPSITTLTFGPTVIWAPPMKQLTEMVTSCAANLASRNTDRLADIFADQRCNLVDGLRQRIRGTLEPADALMHR